MQLHIVTSNAVPIYRQIVDQILEALTRGLLSRSQRLPSRRRLAERLVISPHAVGKAYAELRRAGMVEVRAGRGTFLDAGALTVAAAYRRRRLAAAARRLVAEARLFEVPLIEVNDLVGRTYEGRVPAVATTRSPDPQCSEPAC